MKSLREVDFTNHDIQKVLAEAEQYNIEWLSKNGSRVLHRIENPRQFTGFKLPWPKADDKVRLRDGELSVIGGYNGHRKSTIASQIALHVAQFAPVGICSLEEELDDVGARFIRQATCTDNPTTPIATEFLRWSENRIAVWDRLDSVPPAVALSAVYHMIGVLGCKFVVLDSLMMCDVCDDLERERKFVAQLTALAKMYSAHIMLVHHMRKPLDETRIPSKYDLLGASHISNMAQSIFISWEDKALREDRQFGEGDPDKPDHLFIVAKQRYGAFEGRIGLWAKRGMNYAGTSTGKPQPMLMENAA
jgi:twinkle protein